MINQLSLVVFALMLALGQLLFKRIGLSIHGAPVVSGLLSILLQPVLYAALALYGLATVLWIWILSRVPLTQAYPWVAVTVVIVVLLGWWIYHERPSPIFWLGLALVAIGVVLTQYGSQNS
jgi:drug/metabolite transporter (DMT)-like permease